VIQPLKLYSDVCCSKRLPLDLLALYKPQYPDLEARHLLEGHKTDAADSDWLAPLRDKGWIVITCDHGKDKKKERLPLICRAWKITHIALSPTLLRKGPTHQKNAIVSVWEEIFDLDKYPAGTQVVLGENGTARSGATRFALRPKLEAGRD
jgi:hypothetical protein